MVTWSNDLSSLQRKEKRDWAGLWWAKQVRSIPGDFSGRSLSETANQGPVMWYSTGQPVPDSWLKIALSDISNSKAGIWILFYYHLPECNCEASSLTGQPPV